MKRQFLLLLLCGLAFAPDCCIAQSGMPEPPCIIYKTKKNYDSNVAVGLSEDKSRIVSYPHPRDVFTRGELCTPVRLVRRYRLDRRGLGPNVAFLSITYEEYSRLEGVPSINELDSMGIDRNPIKKMYICPVSAPQDHLKELNRAIRRGCKGFEKIIP